MRVSAPKSARVGGAKTWSRRRKRSQRRRNHKRRMAMA